MAATMIATDRTPWFDADTGVLDRRIFSDRDIYQQELQRIFARAWNFVCHESQLPQSGSLLHELHRRRPGDRGARPHRRDQRAAELVLASRQLGVSRRTGSHEQFSVLVSRLELRPRRSSRRDTRPGSVLSQRRRQDEMGLGQSRAGGELSRLRVRNARPDSAAARRLSRLGGPARHRHARVERRTRGGRRHPEEPPEVQLEARGRQPVRLVSREDLARLRVAHRLRAGRSDGADEPDGDPRRIRPRHRRPGHHAGGTRRVRSAHARAVSASRSGTT